MNIKRRPYTVGEVTSILDKKKSGISSGQIANDLGRTRIAIDSVIGMHKRFIRKESIQSPVLTRIFERIIHLEETNGITPNTPPQIVTGLSQEESLKQFDQAMNTFQQELVSFIDREATRRSEQKVKDLKEKYEKELAKMQTILVEAQSSSVVGLIKRKWGME